MAETVVDSEVVKALADQLEAELADARAKAAKALRELISVSDRVGEFFDDQDMNVSNGDYDNPSEGLEGLVRQWVKVPNELEIISLFGDLQGGNDNATSQSTEVD